MSPHAEHFYDILRINHLVHKPMLDVDPARDRSCQVSNKLLIWWGSLVWILSKNRQKKYCFTLQIGVDDFLCVLLGLFSKN